jgi:hypothetical protein
MCHGQSEHLSLTVIAVNVIAVTSRAVSISLPRSIT